jgi:hypothetical protein
LTASTNDSSAQSFATNLALQPFAPLMQDEIGLERERLRNRLLTVRSFFTDFRLEMAGQDCTHTLPHSFMIVRD